MIDGKEIKKGLIDIDRSQKWLQFVLKERGFQVASSELSRMINGIRHGHSVETIKIEALKAIEDCRHGLIS